MHMLTHMRIKVMLRNQPQKNDFYIVASRIILICSLDSVRFLDASLHLSRLSDL